MNFILRSIIKKPIESRPVKDIDPRKNNRLETNTVIGESYNLVTAVDCPDEFEKILTVDRYSDYRDDVFGFITCYDGSMIIPLFHKREWYVMTESGKTFSKLQ